jgi:hypothetical protein
MLERVLPDGREAVPWATTAAVLVLARLCEPSSELHIAETWYRATALEDPFALPAPLVNDDPLYRALDCLFTRTPCNSHLVARLGKLFDLDYNLLLYDDGRVLRGRRPLPTRSRSADRAAITGPTANRSVSLWS